MKKKIMSSLLIGAFVFGVSAANVQTVSASSPDKVKEISDSYDKIFVSAGKVGYQVELAPADLMSVVNCKPAEIV